jgi:hypothetical protein
MVLLRRFTNLRSKKQAKMQLLQDPNQGNVHNLNNVRCLNSSHFRKKKEYLKTKTDELETNSKNKRFRDLYKGIDYFKKG